eukprot:2739386-Pyramimonas_sp.AAC.1
MKRCLLLFRGLSATPPINARGRSLSRKMALSLMWHRRNLVSPSGQEPGTQVRGDVFVDGSSSRRVIRELSRAASSVVM